MKYACPKCSAPLPTERLLLDATCTCEACGAAVCYGNFWQWLGAVVLGIALAFGASFMVLPAGPVAVALAVVAAAVMPIPLLYLLARPRPYVPGTWFTR